MVNDQKSPLVISILLSLKLLVLLFWEMTDMSYINLWVWQILMQELLFERIFNLKL